MVNTKNRTVMSKKIIRKDIQLRKVFYGLKPNASCGFNNPRLKSGVTESLSYEGALAQIFEICY